MSEAAAPQCPLSLDALASNFQKHVDPKAPVPLRMMGAKALVPMGPKDMTTALYMLSFDADPAVRETAAKSAAALPDRMLAVALRDETVPQLVLDYYAGVLAQKPEYVEMILLNAATADETVARVATVAPDHLLEIISQNQLRLLRHDAIVRALVENPATRPATVDSVTDFCVRSGLVLEDLPAFKAARRRIHGGSDQEAAQRAAHTELEQAAAEAALETMGAAKADPEQEAAAAAAQAEEDEKSTKRMSITQQVARLTIAKKIEWANKKGNKEVRTILLRDPNKLVQMAVVQSPRITEGELAKIAQSRTAPTEVLSYLYNNRQLMKNYMIKVNLVNNPKVPVAVAMRFLSLLRAAELKTLAKNKNVPNALSTAARRLAEKASK